MYIHNSIYGSQQFELWIHNSIYVYNSIYENQYGDPYMQIYWTELCIRISVAFNVLQE